MTQRGENAVSSVKIFGVILIYSFAQAVFAEDNTLNKDLSYSIIAEAFIYHAYSPQETFTQYFQNDYIAIETKTSYSTVDSVVLGTFFNSSGHRCLLIGAHRNWYEFSSKLTFEGIYAYAGEFFTNLFSKCGSEGIYKKIDRVVGIGFAPYFYHGFEYDLNPNASLEAGVILPGIVVLTVQWHF